MSPKAEETILETAAVVLVAVIAYVAYINPAGTVPETNIQTGRYVGKLSKNKSNSIPSSNRKPLQTRIADPYSPLIRLP